MFGAVTDFVVAFPKGSATEIAEIGATAMTLAPTTAMPVVTYGRRVSCMRPP